MLVCGVIFALIYMEVLKFGTRFLAYLSMYSLTCSYLNCGFLTCFFCKVVLLGESLMFDLHTGLHDLSQYGHILQFLMCKRSSTYSWIFIRLLIGVLDLLKCRNKCYNSFARTIFLWKARIPFNERNLVCALLLMILCKFKIWFMVSSPFRVGKLRMMVNASL